MTSDGWLRPYTTTKMNCTIKYSTPLSTMMLIALRVVDRVGRQGRHVDGLAHRVAQLVHPGQRQQVLDEHAHPRGLALDPPHRLPDLVGRARCAHAEELGVAADRSERCPQLVAGVGDEPAHPRLALLPRDQCVVDGVEQRVQRAGHPADLGVLVDVRVGDALGDLDLAARQLQPAHPGGGGGDPLERAQRPAQRHHPGDRRERCVHRPEAQGGKALRHGEDGLGAGLRVADEAAAADALGADLELGLYE